MQDGESTMSITFKRLAEMLDEAEADEECSMESGLRVAFLVDMLTRFLLFIANCRKSVKWNW